MASNSQRDGITNASGQRPRVPLGVKNTFGTSTPNYQSSGKAVDDSSSFKQSPTYVTQGHLNAHLQPSPRITQSNSTLRPSAQMTSLGGYKHAAHQPSPLGGGSSLQTQRIGNSSYSPGIAITPKKRRIPVEEVHCRNVVQVGRGEGETERDQYEGVDENDERELSPKKRSRSSNDGSSATDPSTSTSLSISHGINDLHVQAHSIGQCRVANATSQLQGKGASENRGKGDSQSGSAPPHPRPTTVRIDKQSRMTEAERVNRERQRKEHAAEWRRKFIKAFPNFCFHLDGFDEATRAEVQRCVETLGGRIEPFFSNEVTHLVTMRKIPIGMIPTDTNSSNSNKPASSSHPTPTTTTVSSRAPPVSTISKATGKPIVINRTNNAHVAQSAAKASSKTISLKRKNNNVPLHSDRNPFEESGPPVGSNDILVKARNFNIKVWTYDKFRQVISGLLGELSDASILKRQNLSQMLEKEKLQGTLERDPTATRSDYHYFGKTSIFVLVEDATAEHRPIMVQEFQKPARDDVDSPWPVLYGELEGRCPFTKFDVDKDHRKRIRPNRHESLRRSVSLNHLHTKRKGSVSPGPSGDGRMYSIPRGASPYPLASGNSVTITSNIASTTSAAVGSQSGFGGSAPTGLVAQLGRKMHQPMGIGMGRPSSVAPNLSAPQSPAFAGSGGVGGSGSGQGQVSAEQARGTLVRRMLGMSDHQNRLGGIRRSVSTASAGRELRKEKKPGYCENCRLKYDDFEEHVSGRRHRKFAIDDANFADIDQLLSRVVRPLAPWVAIASEEGGPDTDTDSLSVGHSGSPVSGVASDRHVSDGVSPHTADDGSVAYWERSVSVPVQENFCQAEAMQEVKDGHGEMPTHYSGGEQLQRYHDGQRNPATYKDYLYSAGQTTASEGGFATGELSVGATTATDEAGMSPDTNPDMDMLSVSGAPMHAMTGPRHHDDNFDNDHQAQKHGDESAEAAFSHKQSKDDDFGAAV